MTDDDMRAWRVLDPGVDARRDGEARFGVTVYDPATLLVGGLRNRRAEEALNRVEEIAGSRQLGMRRLDDATTAKGGEPVIDRGEGVREPEVLDILDKTWVTAVELLPGEETAPAPDAWVVLQELRRRYPAVARQVSLNHLVVACSARASWTAHGIWGSHPVFEGSGIWGSHPVTPASSYAMPGSGGRMPVHLTVADPYRPVDGRRPVVAVLDTGVGTHPWFTHGIRPASSIEFDGVAVGTVDVDRAAAVDDLLDGQLPSHIGHGTFIAGLIRQGCPEADVLNIPVLDAYGATDDATVIRALSNLAAHQARARARGDDAALVDVVSLSLGYYHESPDDLKTDEVLRPIFVELSKLGIAVTAAAGNDATQRVLIPAGFSTIVTKPVPVTSVGALNPGGGSKAMFSNDGDWVSCHRRGAALVSTMPTTLQGSLQGMAGTPGLSAPARSTLDPDDFSSGFGVWSGTSFAAPLLAAEIAKARVGEVAPVPETQKAVAAVVRGARRAKQDRPSRSRGKRS